MDTDRIIDLHPEAVPGQRWDGHLRRDPQPAPRHWCAGDCERVERMMTDDLGPLADGERLIVIEGGSAPVGTQG